MTCEILGLFVQTLTADSNYALRNSDNLPQPIEMQLSKKEIVLSDFFAQFLNI